MATQKFEPFTGKLDAATQFEPFDGTLDGEAPKPASIARKLGDLGLGFASGAVGATKALTDVAGAGNQASKILADVNTGINDYLSPEAKADQQAQSRIMSDASGKGAWEGVKAGAKAFAVAPVQTAVQGLGSVVPIVAGAALTGGAAPAAAVGAGLGAAMGAGTAKGAIYDEIKKRGGTEDQAVKAQEYGGENTDQIALGGALGVADALTGVSKAASGVVRSALGKPLAQAATQTAERGIVKRAGMGMLGEMPLEAAQGGQEQVASNLAAQRAGYEAGTWDNVASNATMEALASAGPGATFGALHTSGAKATQPAPVITPPGPELGQPPSTPLATVQSEEQGAPNVPQTTPPDGRAVLNAQQEQQRQLREAQLAAQRAVASPDDEIFASTGALDPPAAPVAPSVQMGIDPNAGPISKAAAMAVDSGAYGQAQQNEQAALQAELAQGRAQTPVIDYSDLEDYDRARIDDYYQQLDEDTRQHIASALDSIDIPDFGDAGNVSDEDFLRAMGASNQEIQDAISITGRTQGAPEGLTGAAALASDVTNGTRTGVGASQDTAQAEVVNQGAIDVGDRLEPTDQSGDSVSGGGDISAGSQPDRGLRPDAAGQRGDPVTTTPTPSGTQTLAVGTADAGNAVARPADWRRNTISAGRVARALGLAPKGKQLAQIVSEIEAFDAQQTPITKSSAYVQTPEARTEAEPQAEAARDQAPEAVASDAATAAKLPGAGSAPVESAGVAQVTGPKINKLWTAFSPESGTRGIPRAQMPQIKAEHRGAMVNFLNARDITHTQEEVPATSLKPTQAEFSKAKVNKALGFTGNDRSILVSSDNHVLDGHHQWMAKLNAGESVKVIRLDAPIDQLLAAVKEFPSASTSAGATPAAPTAEPPKPKKTASLKERIAANLQARADYFTPGNIVKGYSGHDRVVSYQPPGANGEGWHVTVQAVIKQGDQWVQDPQDKRTRTHSTMPDARELARGPVERSPQPTETTNAQTPEAQQVQTQPKAGTAASISEPAAGTDVAAPAEAVESPSPALAREVAPQPEVSRFNGKFGKGMGRDAARLEAARLNRSSKGITYTAEEHNDPKLENPYAVVGRKPVKKTSVKAGGKSTATDNGVAMFSRADGYSEAVDSAIAAAVRGEDPGRGHVSVGNPSGALIAAGIADQPLRTSGAILAKAHFDHGVTKAMLKAIPDLIDAPTMVFKSDTVPGSYVVITKEWVAGKPLMVAIKPTQDLQGKGFNFVPSAYPRNQVQSIQGWIDKGLLTYIDTKQSPQWFDSAGLQLPRDLRTTKGLQARNIASEADIVNVDPKESRAPYGTPSTIAEVQKAIRQLIGITSRNQLGGTVATTAADIKATWEPLLSKKVNLESEGEAGMAQAFYDPKSKTVFLIADRIREGTETAVLAHELMHKHGQTVLGKGGWDRLHDVIGTWANADKESPEYTVWRYAANKVAAVGEQLSNQELFPYAVEAAFKMGITPNAVARQGTVARWLASVVQSLKMVWAKVTRNPDAFSAQDMVNLAFGIAQMENPANTEAIGGSLRGTNEAMTNNDVVGNQGGRSADDTTPGVKPSNLDDGHDFKTAEGKFTTYYWDGDKRQGEVTVHKGKSGYTIRNINLPDSAQRKGLGTQIYAWVNKQSIEATGKPLQSTKARTLLNGTKVFEISDAGKSLWRSLERKGLATQNEDGSYTYAKPNESTAPDSGGAPMMSMANSIANMANARKTEIVGNTGRYTPEQLRAMKNVGFQVETPSLKDRAQALWKDAGKKLAQGIADQFAPIKSLDQEAYGLLRLSKGASGAFEAFLKGGKLKITEGVYDFDDTNKGGVVDKLLIPLQGEHHDFMRWVAANRAERLAAEGKENLFTAQDIKDLKTLAEGTTNADYTVQTGPRKGRTTRDRAEMYADANRVFNEFNKNVLDLAEQSGLIDGSSRKVWERDFYVPFYRVADADTGGVRGMSVKGSALRQQAFKELKGGKNALNADLLDNTLMNWAHLLDASAKNRAAKATIEAAERMGIATGGNQSTLASMGTSINNKNGVVWFMDGGQKRYSLLDDKGDGPYVMTALNALEYAGMRNPAMNAMSAMKHALTVGVTASPFFKVKNLIRDSVQAIGSGNLSYNPAKNIASGNSIVESGKAFKNLGKAIANTATLGATNFKLDNSYSDDYFRLLAGGGTIHFGSMLEGSEAKRVQALVESGVDESTILNSDQKVKAFYRKFIEPGIEAYNELGNRGEAINRAALYDQLRKQGVGHADASLQARDLMDFSMQGTFTSIRFLTQVVPFFNARIQGMYKLGRSAKENPARFGAVLGATAMVSLALLAAYSDDDDWKKREEWDRNNFWWFKFGDTAFRIPKPFELGAIGTLAERSAELAFDNEMTSKRYGKQIMTLLGDNLSMNPVPQLVKPILDVYANKDSFSGRPIETMSMERLQPEYRFTDRTSMTARAASTGLNAVTNVVGVNAPSPVQIDSMLRGYFGWLGSFIVGAADKVARPLTDQPGQASSDYWKTATGSMVSNLQDAPSRYVSAMYDQAKEIEQAYGTWRALVKEGKAEEAADFAKSNKEDLGKYRQVERIKQIASSANQRIRMIERSAMDADTKRTLIREIQARKDKAARALTD